MLHRLRARLSYANLTATAALFIALGGTSYAALSLPANSVGPRQLRKDAVSTRAIHNSTIRGSDVRRDTLTGADVREATLAIVPRAFTATSAERLAGNPPDAFKVHCPAGTAAAAGGCIEQAGRAPLSLQNAAAGCGAIGRRLASYAELIAYLNDPAHPSLSGSEWTSNLTAATNAIVVTLPDGTPGEDALATPHPFRCATTPTD